MVTTASTVFARIFIGVVCDRFGPRYGEPASSTMSVCNRHDTLPELKDIKKIFLALPSLAACPAYLCMPYCLPTHAQRMLLIGIECCKPFPCRFIASQTPLCHKLVLMHALLAAYGYLLAATAIPVFCMAVVRNAAGYIIERIFIGCSLASFVVCQFWSSIMFSPNVVGMSNAIAGGWGNAGEHHCSFLSSALLVLLLRPFHSLSLLWCTLRRVALLRCLACCGRSTHVLLCCHQFMV